jgi:hypothetical protein
MNAEILKRMLAWCTVINFAILIIWFAFFMLAHDWMRDVPGRWFRVSSEQFDFAELLTMSIYKIGIILFNLVPYLALRIARRDAT